jgi:hypothetical protein
MAFDSSPHRLRRALPSLLAVGMLVLLLVVALAPETGALPAQSDCQYGNCSTASNTTPLWAWAAVGLFLLLLAALVAILLVRHRRRGGGGASSQPPPEATFSPQVGTPPAPPEGSAVPAAAVAAPAGVAAAAAPAYLETEDDVSAPPTVMPAAAPAPAPAAAAPEGGEEPNIDSLMDELDRISGEILKKEPKGKGPPSAPAESPPEGSS